jgi:hypothetical protein
MEAGHRLTANRRRVALTANLQSTEEKDREIEGSRDRGTEGQRDRGTEGSSG